MAFPVAAAVAGSLAAAAYLDARLLIRHDLSSGSIAGNKGKAVQFVTERFKQDRILMYHVLEDQATGPNANNLFLMFEGRTWTFRQFFDDMQRVGNWLMNDLGIKRGELVAVNGGNTPEYLLMWFALDGIGASIAFINCNLTAQPLLHCVKLADSRYLLADRATQNLVEPCRSDMEQANIQIQYYDRDFVAALADTTPLPQARRSGIRPEELKSLIYTSGTTGLPKGTVMLTGREINTARSVAEYLKLKPGDRMYSCLPMYHGAGHSLCVTPSIFAGSTIVLSRKFSHKLFWPEIRESEANIVQYVGELCRYLINAPPNPLDRQNKVTKAWGNGMRPDVWEVFRQRFGIETINELYAATDGLGATFNENRGEFGRNALALRGAYWNWQNGANEKRVKIDVVTEEFLRDQNGFAIACKAGEPGEVLHRLDPATADAAFAGYYKNAAAGEKRKVGDVFAKGDLWFRSGDMMRQDADGCVYFVDRLGDTFRWKSENVSTSEVGDHLGDWDQIAEANVYGVQVPHADGRAGCAAIVLAQGVSEEQFDFAGLAKRAVATLPRYAVPIFLRVVKEMQYTGTMKLQKGKMRADGIDLDKIEASTEPGGLVDAIYWLPPGTQGYVPFGKQEWAELTAGRVRL